MLLVRVQAILRLQLLSRAHSCSLICRGAQEPSFLNFRPRSLQKLFILPKDAIGAISRNSETQTIFTSALALVNLPLLLRALLFEYSCAIASNNIYLA